VTLIAYECNARRLCAWCDAQKFNSLSDLDFAKTNQYATEQRAVRSSVGVKMEIALFRRAWEKAKKMKHVAFDENPWSMTFKTSTAEKEPYSDEEIRAIFGLAMPQWLRVFCMVALYTGGRIGSIRLLTWEDLDCDVGVVHFRSSKTGPYSVPMHPVLLRFLQPIRGQGLIRAGQTDQVTSSLVVATLRKLSRKPVTKGGLGWTAHFHRFRHTFNTALMQSGVSRTVAMHLMNHRSEKVNSVYSHVDVLKFSKELERLTFGAPMAH
jgi:integrase